MLAAHKFEDMLCRIVEHALESDIPCDQLEAEIRKRFLQIILDQHKGNQVQVAKAIRIHRNTLRLWLQKLNIQARRQQ